MSSGFGIRGGPGRCFEHFQDIARCSQSAENIKVECSAVYGDYMECLHGTRERERLMIVKYVATKEKKDALKGNQGGHH